MNANSKWVGVSVAILLALAGILWFVFTSPETPQPTAVDPVTNKFAEEEKDAREAYFQHPKDGLAALRLVRVLRKREKYAAAHEVLAQAAKLGVPENEGRKEAVLLLSVGDWPPQAEGMFQRVVKDFPDDSELLHTIAKAYSRKGRDTEAAKLFDQLLTIDPKRMDWRYQRGVSRMRAAYYTEAIEDLTPVVQQEPDNFAARLYLANSLLGDARISEAEPHLRICHHAQPDHLEPIVSLAKCALETNDWDRAEHLLKLAAQRDGRSLLVLQEQLTLALRRQQTEDAITVAKKILVLDPNHRTTHLQLSQCLLAAGKAEESRIHEKRYQELDRLEEQRLLQQRGMR